MKTVLITGCNKGLGLTLVKEFAKVKYNIIACIRTSNEDFANCCRQLESENGIKIYTVCFDFIDSKRIEEGMQTIADLGLNIDVLINNAGINISKPLMFTEYSDVFNSFTVNYFAPFLITKHISEIMIRQGEGSIINISSMMSLSHQPGGSCYNTSKAALNQFTISIAQELAPFNIRVNAVACGPFQAGMFEELQESSRKKLIKATAFKRLATTNEIAETVLFLASNNSSFITGQIICVDGGAIL